MIDLSNISLQFTGEYLFHNVNLKINSGDKICLFGSNGTGKSSLLKMLVGQIEPESGSIQKQKTAAQFKSGQRLAHTLRYGAAQLPRLTVQFLALLLLAVVVVICHRCVTQLKNPPCPGGFIVLSRSPKSENARIKNQVRTSLPF